MDNFYNWVQLGDDDAWAKGCNGEMMPPGAWWFNRHVTPLGSGMKSVRLY